MANFTAVKPVLIAIKAVKSALNVNLFVAVHPEARQTLLVALYSTFNTTPC